MAPLIMVNIPLTLSDVSAFVFILQNNTHRTHLYRHVQHKMSTVHGSFLYKYFSKKLKVFRSVISVYILYVSLKYIRSSWMTIVIKWSYVLYTTKVYIVYNEYVCSKNCNKKKKQVCTVKYKIQLQITILTAHIM